MADYHKLQEAIADLDEETVHALLNEILADGGSAADALNALQEGMEVVGSRYEVNQYYLSDLIFGGEIMTGAVEILKPLLAAGGSDARGRMILCTVKSDLHDIGKNIVRSLMEGAGFEVVDLGIDVPPEKVVETAKEQDIRIVALSGVLTLALESMANTVKAFEDAGMRDKVKIIIGGSPVSEKSCELIGADEWAKSPQKGVDVCKQWAIES